MCKLFSVADCLMDVVHSETVESRPSSALCPQWRVCCPASTNSGSRKDFYKRRDRAYEYVVNNTRTGRTGDSPQYVGDSPGHILRHRCNCNLWQEKRPLRMRLRVERHDRTQSHTQFLQPPPHGDPRGVQGSPGVATGGLKAIHGEGRPIFSQMDLSPPPAESKCVN